MQLVADGRTGEKLLPKRRTIFDEAVGEPYNRNNKFDIAVTKPRLRALEKDQTR